MKNKHFLLAAAALVALAGCTKPEGEDTKEGRSLEAPEISSEIVATSSSLTFSWAAVENAAQYGYTLYDSSEKVVKGPAVVNDLTVTITGLEGETTYKFELWAIPSASSKLKKSESAFVEAATNKDIPPIEFLIGKYSVLSSGSSWADYTAMGPYTFTDDLEIIRKEGTDNQIVLDGFYWTECPIVGTVDFGKKTITFPAQPYGEYYTFAGCKSQEEGVVATFDDDYTITFENWSAWYYNSEYGSWDPYFKKTKVILKKGEKQFATDADGYLIFGKSPVDAIIGTYVCKTSGTEYLSYDDDNNSIATEFSQENYAYIYRVNLEEGDTKVWIDGFYEPWNGYYFIADVDMAAKTITIQPDSWGYYWFAADAADKAVVGKINDDGTLSFSGWNMWYYFPASDGYDAAWYYYAENTETVFTPYVGE